MNGVMYRADKKTKKARNRSEIRRFEKYLINNKIVKTTPLRKKKRSMELFSLKLKYIRGKATNLLRSSHRNAVLIAAEKQGLQSFHRNDAILHH